MGQWVNFHIYNRTNDEMEIKNAQNVSGMFYEPGPTNEEVPPSYYEGRLRTGSECLICSCGRDTSSGTEGSFDLCDISSGSVIAHIYWDCVAVGTNKFEISTEGSNYNYWKVQSQNHPSTGPLGDLRISVTRDY